MPSVRIIALVAVSLLMSACAMWPFDIPAMTGASADSGPNTPSTAGMPGVLEPIHAAAFTNDIAVFRVSSNGCTERDDITPIVTRAPDQDAVITLRRIDEDDCKALNEDGVELIWSFEELGLAPGELVDVNNPYLLAPTPAADDPRS